MRSPFLPIALCAAVVAIASTGTATDAYAAKKSSSTTTERSKKKNEKNDSSESQAERDKRLYRECQGLPNAGACSGYTRR